MRSVLFDGKDLSEWKDGDKWIIKDGYAISAKTGITTKRTSAIASCTSNGPRPPRSKGAGQGRGNSGVYMMERYEIQVLDSYDNPDLFRRPGRLDLQAAPADGQRLPQARRMANLRHHLHRPAFRRRGQARPSPPMSPSCTTASSCKITPKLLGGTFYDTRRHYTAHAAKAPIHLQYHGNPVRFRNIWIREMKPIHGTKS